MASIAQAVVRVLPDLTGFAGQLRTDLAKQIKLVGVEARTVTLYAKFDKETKTTLQGRLNKMAFRVEVTPVLAPGSRKKLLEEIGAGTVPVQVRTVAAPAVAATGSIAAPAAIAAAASIPPEVVATGRPLAVLEQEARLSGAITKSVEAQAALNKVTAQAVIDTDALSVAQARLQESSVNLTLETEKLAAVRERAATASPEQKAAAEAAALAAKAQREQEVAGTRLASSQAAVAEATGFVTKATINETTAKQANAIISESLRKVNLDLAAATRSEDRETAAQIEISRKRLLQLREEVAARELLARAQLNLGALVAAGPAVSSTDAAAKAASAERLLTELEVVRTKAVDAEAGAVAKLVLNMEAQVRGLQVTAKAEQIAAVATEANAVANERLVAIRASVAAAINPDFTLAEQRRKLTAIESQLTKQIELYSVATSGATAADIESLRAEEVKIAQLQREIGVRIKATAAAEQQAAKVTQADRARSRGFGQAERGAAATGATFLGLRGAVLSASTGFLAATVAVTGLAKIIKTAEDLQKSLDVFQATSSATADQMAAVDKQARLLGADLSLPATSATDAAQAMTELAKAGLSVEQSMAAAKGVLQLSAAAGIDVGSSANLVATELNAFGLAGEKATHVVDALAGASIAAQGDITDFGLAFQQTSAVAHQVGLSFDTTTAILTEFAKAGLHGSDAGTSLRTMLLRLVPTSKTATDAMEGLGIKINRNIPIGAQFASLVDQYTVALAKLGPIARQEVLTKIFGQDAIRGATIALTHGSTALIELQDTVTKAGNAAQITKGRTEGLTGATEGLKSEVSTLSATIGTEMLPFLQSTVHVFAGVASGANAIATSVNSIIVKSRGFTNFLGGADVLAKIVLAVSAGLAARKAINAFTNDDQRLRAKEEKLLLSIQGITDKWALSQEKVNFLLEQAGLNAEDVEAIQIRLNVKQQESLLTNRELLGIYKEIQTEVSTLATTGVAGPRIQAAEGAAVAAAAATTEGAAAAQAAWAAERAFVVDSAGTVTIAEKAAATAMGEANVAGAAVAGEAWGKAGATAATAAEEAATTTTAATGAISADLAGLAETAAKSSAGRVTSNELVIKSLMDEALATKVAAAGYDNLLVVVAANDAKIIALNEAAAASAAGIGTGAGAAGGGAPGAGIAAPAAEAGIIAKIIAKARGKGFGQGISGKGLGAGIGLSILGGILPGEAGKFSSSLGTGATLGSFVGPEGAVVGAAAFGLLDLLQASNRRAKAEQDKLKTKWQQMDAVQQAEFLRENFPNLAPGDRFIQNKVVELLSREKITTPSAPGRFPGPRTPVKQTARDFVQSVGGLTDDLQKQLDDFRAAQKKRREVADAFARSFLPLPGGTGIDPKTGLPVSGVPAPPKAPIFKPPGKFEGLVAQGTINLLDRPAVKVKGDFGTVFSISIQNPLNPSQEVIIPQIYDGKLHSQSEAIAHYLDTLRKGKPENLGIVGPTPGSSAVENANALADAIHNLGFGQGPAAFLNTFHPQAFATPTVKPVKVSPPKLVVDKVAEAANELALAELSGDQKAIDAATAKQIKVEEQLVNRLKNQATPPASLFDKGIPALQAWLDAHKQAIADYTKGLNDLNAQIQAANQKAITAIQTPSFTVDLATIKAAGTKTLSDDLSAAIARQAEVQKKLARLQALHAAGVKKDPRGGGSVEVELKAAQKAAAEAANAVTAAQQQITDQGVQAAKTQVDIVGSRLQRAAEAAGNIGAAENKYIAFLKAQIGKTKAGSAERLAAENAYNDELKKRQDALKAIAQQRIDLRRSGLDLAMQRAQATATTADDIKVFRGYISADLAEVKLWQRVVKSAKSSVADKIAAQIEISRLRKDILSQQQAITGVTSGGSPQDLFKEAISQFQQFASNVSSQPMDLGQVRGQFAGTLIATMLNSKADRTELKLTEVSGHTGSMDKTLTAILTELQRKNGDLPPTAVRTVPQIDPRRVVSRGGGTFRDNPNIRVSVA